MRRGSSLQRTPGKGGRRAHFRCSFFCFLKVSIISFTNSRVNWSPSIRGPSYVVSTSAQSKRRMNYWSSNVMKSATYAELKTGITSITCVPKQGGRITDNGTQPTPKGKTHGPGPGSKTKRKTRSRQYKRSDQSNDIAGLCISSIVKHLQISQTHLALSSAAQAVSKDEGMSYPCSIGLSSPPQMDAPAPLGQSPPQTAASAPPFHTP